MEVSCVKLVRILHSVLDRPNLTLVFLVTCTVRYWFYWWQESNKFKVEVASCGIVIIRSFMKIRPSVEMGFEGTDTRKCAFPLKTRKSRFTLQFWYNIEYQSETNIKLHDTVIEVGYKPISTSSPHIVTFNLLGKWLSTLGSEFYADEISERHKGSGQSNLRLKVRRLVFCSQEEKVCMTRGYIFTFDIIKGILFEEKYFIFCFGVF
jgi:hypothetical protein